MVFATLKFADGKMAHIHCSWLDPHKIRKMTVVGPEKMVTFDDMEATEKIRIYDKGAAVRHDITTSYADIISLRFGDIIIPKIPGGEPLSLECQHFIDCVLGESAGPQRRGGRAAGRAGARGRTEVSQEPGPVAGQPGGILMSEVQEVMKSAEEVETRGEKERLLRPRIRLCGRALPDRQGDQDLAFLPRHERGDRSARTASSARTCSSAGGVVIGNNVKVQNNVAIYTGDGDRG